MCKCIRLLTIPAKAARERYLNIAWDLNTHVAITKIMPTNTAPKMSATPRPIAMNIGFYTSQ